MKDRDSSQDSSISRNTRTPARVGLVGTAVLAGSALVAACGGGDSRSTGTPEGGVKGAQSNPTTGQTIEVKTAALPSATAVQEAPTVEPTATVEAKLTQDQMLQIADNVKQLITAGLSESHVTNDDFTKRGLSLHYGELQSITMAVQVCSQTKIGDPFVDNDTGRTVTTSDPDYALMLLNNCSEPAIATKALFEITGNVQFKKANEAWKPIHAKKVLDIRPIEPRADDSYWQGVLSRAYINPQQ